MESWRLDIKKGINYLSRHKPECAIKFFYGALEKCPVSHGKELSRLLFYLGITLKRLGYLNPAIKSWLASQRLKKKSFALKMVKRFTNGYGMERQSCEEMDDWKAFYSIQLVRYIARKKKKQFYSTAEKDMIKDLIKDHFNNLRFHLKNKTIAQKKSLFQREKIIFPYCIPSKKVQNNTIHINFFRNKRVSLSERCPCGSGLNHMVCCGRTPGEIELLNGAF